MKKALFLTLAAVLVLASAASAGVVKASKHDLSSTGTGQSDANFRSTNVDQVCVFCHTPHNASATMKPLWNRSGGTDNYTKYSNSPTLNASISDFSGSSNVISALCMSCHDGTIGLGSLLNKPGAGSGTTPSNSAQKLNTGAAYLGTDLSNDHPVNFTFSDVVSDDPEIKNPSDLTWVAGDSMQCSSCHDVHDPDNAPFLNKSNSGSGLCLECHSK